MHLIFVIGATNAGKSTLIAAAKELGHGTVEVGKMMRAKYPPEYFKGQACPAHTEVESWDMMLEGVEQVRKQGLRACFIDGQPRTHSQLAKVIALHDAPGSSIAFLHLWAPRDVREARARERDKNDPGRLALSLERLDGDLAVLYDITALIVRRPAILHRVWNTNQEKYNPLSLVKDISFLVERE